MKIDQFDFKLPDDLIATHPIEPRDHARLLYVKKDKTIHDRHVYDLPDLLKPNDLIVYNNSKVIPARLYGTREGFTGQIEILLHKNIKASVWEAWAKPARKLSIGGILVFSDDFKARVIDKPDTGFVHIDFECDAPKLFQKLDQYGLPPLPPYIKRDAIDKDTTTYQTVYAKHEGSVAAPTAGLHFTPDLMQRLKDKNIQMTAVTLHVGAGTFKPVMVDDTDDHLMHAEYGEISIETADLINKTRKNGGRIITVGTTSTRLLESATDNNHVTHPFCDETSIFITPDYTFKAIDGLITNFHLPKSTLFMLVSAFMGTDTMKQAYAHAIDHQYRFFSYGDACLLERG